MDDTAIRNVSVCSSVCSELNLLASIQLNEDITVYESAIQPIHFFFFHIITSSVAA